MTTRSLSRISFGTTLAFALVGILGGSGCGERALCPAGQVFVVITEEGGGRCLPSNTIFNQPGANTDGGTNNPPNIVDHACDSDNDCMTVTTGNACEAPTVDAPSGRSWQRNEAICVPSCRGNVNACTVYGLVCNTETGLNGEQHEDRCRRECSTVACPADMNCLPRGSKKFCFPNRCNTSNDCPSGMSCDLEAKICRSNGVECTSHAQCGAGRSCIGNRCQLPACNDGVMNGSETDLDCGGTCSKCSNGKRCAVAGDCSSGVCSGGVCQAQQGGCAAGETSCNGSCKNLASDLANCGACGKACGANQICSNSACVQAGAGRQAGEMCAVDGECLTGFFCGFGRCTVPLCVAKVNDADFIVWGNQQAGQNLGLPTKRTVRVVDNGAAKDLEMFCGVGTNVGSVTTSMANKSTPADKDCVAIGFGNSNVVTTCKDTQFQSWGAFR